MTASGRLGGEAVQPPKQGAVHIYIDNSNLWIEGQKTYARKNNLDVSFDPTWRFDVGRLKNILATKSYLIREGHDPEVKINLYGSTPPPVDTVWQAIESHNVNVRTFARSPYNGREKQVDHEICLDSVEQAFEDALSRSRSEFMIVSGDRDMMSSVSRIDRKGFTVHVWAWKNSMTGAYERDPDLQQVHVHHLDDYLEAIGFCETTFRVDRNTIDPASIVVLDPLPHADAIEAFVNTVRIPVYRYMCAQQRDDASSKDLVIIPAFAWAMTPDEKTELFQTAERALSKNAGALEIITYSAYIQRYRKNLQASKFVLELSNRFHERPAATSATAAAEDGTLSTMGAETSLAATTPGNIDSSNSNGGFTEVRSTALRRRQQFDRGEHLSHTRCIYGRCCRLGRDCKRGHTKDDEAFFKIHAPLKPRKMKPCNKDGCMKGSRCDYAHEGEDLFCPTCENKGHAVGACLRRMRMQD